MNISIRLENENDFRIVENLTREAFWDLYNPGCNEHLIVHKMRKVNAFIKELGFVACDGEKIVGNIMYTKSKVINENNEAFKILTMGPLGILPSYQGKGVGSQLMRHSIKVARALGYNAIAIFGDPNYYHRFGFENAKKYNIQTSWGDNFEEFMALELNEGSLEGISGKCYIDSVFETNEDELKSFEEQFPYKEKIFSKK
ncbi:MAG: N-acetyltransferase [Clostridia bacterium]|nr:N-acetyltransferase [Clostridia bacterium]